MIQSLWWRAFAVLATWLFVIQAGAPLAVASQLIGASPSRAWHFSEVPGTSLQTFEKTLAAAQTEALQVVILQPGEGETYYTSPYGPRTLVPILGRVSGGDFDPQQLDIQLDLLQNGKLVSRETGSADADGAFSFRVIINAEGSAELGTPESNCFSCHEAARLTLPTGASVVRITAVEPTGRKAVTERRVILDHAGLAAATVRVSVRGEPERAVRGLRITAATRVYDWRARKTEALTDAQGQAVLEIEALSQVSTRYFFSVAPILVDGILYQTSAPVEIVLPPGAKSVGPIALAVEAQWGHISGAVSLAGKPPAGPLSVRAVALPYGASFAAPVTGGKFSLADLPIGAYLVSADPDQAAALGYRALTSRLDMANQADASCSLDLALLNRPSVHGIVQDVSGSPLPFGWVEGGEQGLAAPTSPATGAFALHGLAAGIRTLRVSAPGYWSRVVPARSGVSLDVHLEPKPDGRRLSWGSGSLILPGETGAVVAGERISLRRGWLWGTGDRPLTIEMQGASVTIRNGTFALEHLPGERSWLYMTAGEAEVNRPGESPVAVKGGEMAALIAMQVASVQPVPLDDMALRLLATQNPTSVKFAAKPGAWSSVEKWLAVLGLMDVRPIPVALGAAAAVVALVAGLMIRRRANDSRQGR